MAPAVLSAIMSANTQRWHTAEGFRRVDGGAGVTTRRLTTPMAQWPGERLAQVGREAVGLKSLKWRPRSKAKAKSSAVTSSIIRQRATLAAYRSNRRLVAAASFFRRGQKKSHRRLPSSYSKHIEAA